LLSEADWRHPPGAELPAVGAKPGPEGFGRGRGSHLAAPEGTPSKGQHEAPAKPYG